MSKFTITLEDTNDGLTAVMIQVADFDETSNALGLGAEVQDFITQLVAIQNEPEPKYEGTMANILTSRIQ